MNSPQLWGQCSSLHSFFSLTDFYIRQGKQHSNLKNNSRAQANSALEAMSTNIPSLLTLALQDHILESFPETFLETFL